MSELEQLEKWAKPLNINVSKSKPLDTENNYDFYQVGTYYIEKTPSGYITYMKSYYSGDYENPPDEDFIDVESFDRLFNAFEWCLISTVKEYLSSIYEDIDEKS